MSDKLAGVDPVLVRKVLAIINDLKGRYDIVVVEGKRSRARQLWLYSQGRTRPGRKVTWSLKSKHIDGKAADLAPVDSKGRIMWDCLPAFELIGRSARVHGLVWGGSWKALDLCHVELP